MKPQISCHLELLRVLDTPMSLYAYSQEPLWPPHRAFRAGSPDLTSEIVARATAASVLWAAIALQMWCLQ